MVASCRASTRACEHRSLNIGRAILLPLDVSKHRLFVWIALTCCADSATIVFARDDDYFFGVLHSRVHELWARAMGTQLREAESGFRYTPTTTFETFPFPWPPGQEPAGDPRVEAIAAAARELVAKRDAWLTAPAPARPSGSPSEACEGLGARGTLTALYNARPAWLDLAHRALDAAVLDAYGWPHDLSGRGDPGAAAGAQPGAGGAGSTQKVTTNSVEIRRSLEELGKQRRAL